VLNWAAEEFRRDTGIDLRQDRQALQRLREAAEKAKIELSTVSETEINLPFITADAHGPKHLQLKLTRAKLEQLTEHLVARMRGPFEAVLRDAGLAAGEVNEVVLVGGATRMPMAQELVRSLTGKEPHRGVNPDEVVAVGAAIQAGVLSGDVKDVLLLDVTPLSLGLETLGGVMTVLIGRNTTIPVKKTEVFSTAEDGQTAVDIHVLQGERPMAADNMTLGRFRLEGIPAAPRGAPQIEVSFDIDANGILNVAARDKATGKEQRVTITASTNLTEQDIQRMVEEANRHSSEDARQRELVDARNQGDGLAYAADKALRELGDNLPSADRQRIEAKVNELRQAMKEEDIARIRRLADEVQEASHALSQQIGAQQAAGGRTPPASGGPSGAGEGGVIEGEFREA
ncbi:MAG: Hsp70 family protein, partial [Anaerolineales bacterium]